jgi:hypothetical protein
VRRGRILAAFASLFALGFCAPAGAAVGITHPDGPDPAVSAWPSWPFQTTCTGVAFDPVAIFGGPTEAELGTGAPEQALRRYIVEGLYAKTPRHYWRLVAATEATATFASGLLSVVPYWLSFRLADGVWRPVEYARPCQPRSYRNERLAVHWRLAPGQKLTRRTRRVKVVLSYSGCHGSSPIADYVGEPAFVGAKRKLAIAFWADGLPPGPHTCPKPAEPAVTVRLRGKLGKRQLFDGATYPPLPRSSRLRQ